MAETPVEVIIRARNESQAALNQAIGQMKQLEAGTKAASTAGAGFRGLRDIVGQISPAASQAIAQVQGLAAAGTALGPAAVAAGAVAAGIGLIGAAAFSATKALADTVEQLDNLSRITGASVGDLQVLTELFERQGIGADVARTALHRLNIAIAEGNPILKTLGVTARDPIEALFQLSDVLGASTDAAGKAKIAQELLGRGGKDLLAAVTGLRGGFADLNKEMTATGQRMDENLLGTARRLDVMFERAGGRIAGMTNSLKGFAASMIEATVHTNPLIAALFGVERAAAPWQRLTLGAHEFASAQADANKRVKEATEEHTKASAAVQRHAERVRELIDLFGMQKKAAEDIISAQERLERHRRKEAIEKDLGLGGFEIPGIEVKAKLNQDREFPNILPTTESREKMLADWRTFLADIQSSTSVLNEALNGLGSSLTSGFTQVFQGLLSHGQTFRSAMVTIFTSMVNELLAQLARLLAFKIIGALLGAPPVTMGSPGFVYPFAGASAARPATPGPQSAMGGNTFVIQTLDARDLVASLVLPGGSLRTAQDRVAIAGAY